MAKGGGLEMLIRLLGSPSDQVQRQSAKGTCPRVAGQRPDAAAEAPVCLPPARTALANLGVNSDNKGQSGGSERQWPALVRRPCPLPLLQPS